MKFYKDKFVQAAVLVLEITQQKPYISYITKNTNFWELKWINVIIVKKGF